MNRGNPLANFSGPQGSSVDKLNRPEIAIRWRAGSTIDSSGAISPVASLPGAIMR